VFIRRDRRGFRRYTWWRVGLVFLAAGTWLAGVRTARPLVTGAAIVILLAALALGLAGYDERGPPPEE
jgi:hypothetical protein